MGAGNDNVASNIWFSYNGKRGIPVYDDDFKYNPSTNTITIGTGTLTATQYSGNALSAYHASAKHASITSGASGWLKIKIKKKTSWMLAFTIRIYEGYTYYDYVVSGYNYGTNKWHGP
jgi:hypothetical protein